MQQSYKSWCALLALGLASPLSALAGPLDGFYQVLSIEDPHGIRTAEQLQTTGCWSREVWAFQEKMLSRGHQERCPAGKNFDICEAWVTVEVSYADGLTIPYSSRSTAESQRLVVTEESRSGNTTTTLESSTRSCHTRVDTGRYALTIEEGTGGKVLVLHDARRDVKWRLVPARPTASPFSGVAP